MSNGVAKLKELGADEELETAHPLNNEQSERLISEAVSSFGLISAFVFILFLSVIVNQPSFDSLESNARKSVPTSDELKNIDWDQEFALGEGPDLEIMESPRGEERKMTLFNTLSVKRFDSTYGH